MSLLLVRVWHSSRHWCQSSLAACVLPNGHAGQPDPNHWLCFAASAHNNTTQNGVGVVHYVGTYAASASCKSRLKVPQQGLVAPVVIVAYERVHYLARSLMNVLR